MITPDRFSAPMHSLIVPWTITVYKLDVLSIEDKGCDLFHSGVSITPAPLVHYVVQRHQMILLIGKINE